MSYKIECNRCKEQEYIEMGGRFGSFQNVSVAPRGDFSAISNALAQLCPKCVEHLKVWLDLK